MQINLDLITLALYDIVIWADDSTSMSALDGGERIKDLKAILSRVADAAVLFDDDGEPLLSSFSIALKLLRMLNAQNSGDCVQACLQMLCIWHVLIGILNIPLED